MLTWTIYISFLGMALLMCLPKDRPGMARSVALGTALLGLLAALLGAAEIDPAAGVTVLVMMPGCRHWESTTTCRWTASV